MAAIALTFSVGATACSSSSANPGSGAGAGDSFTYWSMWKVGEPQQKVIATAIADYQKQTGAKVSVQWQGRSNMKKLVPALNTNTVPDLVDGSYLSGEQTLAGTDQALGLKDAYAQTIDGTTVSKLIPQKYTDAVDIKLSDGQPWMVPYQIQSDAIWYNGAKYPDLAKNPPKTWDEFMAELNKVKAAGVAPIAADGDIAGYNSAWLTTLIVRTGGPGAFKKLAADKTGQAWKQPAALDAAKKVEQLAKGSYFIKGYQASKFPFQQQQWAVNKAAFIYMGSWLPTESGSYAAPGFDYKSFPFPTTGDGDSMRVDFSGFMVPKKAKNADAAQKFAAFFLNKTYQDDWATKAKRIPVRADAASTPALAGVQNAIKSATAFRQGNDAEAYPGYDEKVFQPNSDKLFLGKFTAAQFVDAMANDQATYWKAQGK
ncbi:MAG: ABC transporter substrate-binding protein [Nakamurella sp.]